MYQTHHYTVVVSGPVTRFNALKKCQETVYVVAVANQPKRYSLARPDRALKLGAKIAQDKGLQFIDKINHRNSTI